MIVLGIDPGLAKGALAVIDYKAGHIARLIAYKKLGTPANMHIASRLLGMQVVIMDFVERHNPQIAVIEQTLVGRGMGASLGLAQARGALLAGLAAAGLTQIFEVANTTVKKNMTGSGKAGKTEVQEAVAKQFPETGKLSADEADAIAIALSVRLIVN